MGLSEKEKQILADMERQFSDVRVAEASVTKSSEPEKSQKLNFSPKLVATMTLLILAGIALLIVGISVWTVSKFLAIAVAVSGFIVVLFAVTLPMNSRFSSFGVNSNKPLITVLRLIKMTLGVPLSNGRKISGIAAMVSVS